MIVLEHLKRITIPSKASLPAVSFNEEIDVYWDKALDAVKGMDSPVEWLEAEDPSFILYTS